MNESIAVTPGPRVFDRLEFLSESPAVGVFLLIVLIFASLIGTFGNMLILVSLCKSKKMNSLECIFIGNLAISDTYVTLVADPMSIIGEYCNSFSNKRCLIVTSFAFFINDTGKKNFISYLFF